MSRIASFLVLAASALGASSASAQAATSQLEGTWCVGMACESYGLVLYAGGAFVDSRANYGTYTQVGTRLTLTFDHHEGTASLRPSSAQGTGCYEPTTPYTASLGQINVCPSRTVLSRVRNESAFCYDYVTGAAPGEEGFYAAASLTPSTDFVVASVRYMLWNGDPGNGQPCEVGAPHRVRIFADDDATPDTDPFIIEEFIVDLDDPSIEEDAPITLTQNLTVPYQLDAGDRLFVAVELVEDGVQAICPTMCHSAYTPNTNWWSNATDPPYAWVTMESFGEDYEMNFRFSILGIAN